MRRFKVNEGLDMINNKKNFAQSFVECLNEVIIRDTPRMRIKSVDHLILGGSEYFVENYILPNNGYVMNMILSDYTVEVQYVNLLAGELSKFAKSIPYIMDTAEDLYENYMGQANY